MGSDDTGAQRGTAREREGAFGNVVIIADVRYSSVTKHYPDGATDRLTGPRTQRLP